MSNDRIEAIAEDGTFKLLARAGMLFLTVVLVPATGFFFVRTLGTLDKQSELLQGLNTKVEVLSSTVAQQLTDRYSAKDAQRDQQAQKIINDQVDYRLRSLEARRR